MKTGKEKPPVELPEPVNPAEAPVPAEPAPAEPEQVPA